MKQDYNQAPIRVRTAGTKEIAEFPSPASGNIDLEVVDSFGEEWNKFYRFDDAELEKVGREYFDIVPESVLGPQSYALDVGCGTGRYSRVLARRAGFIEAVDPSHAVFAAAKLLSDVDNVRVTQASVDNIPFADDTFDFAMSIGVLHHIPDTQRGIADCVKKVKPGGYFYVYLYYALDNRGPGFRFIFKNVDMARRVICRLPPTAKKLVCEGIAAGVYAPMVVSGRIVRSLGFAALADKMPLSYYHSKAFYTMRTDALDRFGTALEQRFTRQQVVDMMTKAGLTNVVVSDGPPYWHALGQKPAASA